MRVSKSKKKKAIVLLSGGIDSAVALYLARKKGFKGKIELSGMITIKNISKYSKLGADVISMGEPTKKANIIDFSMRVK